MPLYKTIAVNSQTTVKIWKIDESYGSLFQPLKLKTDNLERVKSMKSEIHQRGFLSVRHLLRAFGYTDEDLFYDSNGKPHLRDGNQISITHSFNFSAVIVSHNFVGIDIEKQRDVITHIAPKFVDYEFKYLDETNPLYIKMLTVIWCAKEALYKLYGRPGLSFKQHTLVIPFMINDRFTNAWIDFEDRKTRYDINYLEFEGFSCAYATN